MQSIRTYIGHTYLCLTKVINAHAANFMAIPRNHYCQGQTKMYSLCIFYLHMSLSIL